MISLGEFIQESRVQKELSINQFASEMGVTRSTVYKWETGDIVPRLWRIPKMARILGVKQQDFSNEALSEKRLLARIGNQPF